MGIILLMLWLCLQYANGGNAVANPSYWSSSCEVPHNRSQWAAVRSIDALILSVRSHNTSGFYNTTRQVSFNDSSNVGTIYGERFCWGYVSESRCQSCADIASQQILPNCLYAHVAYDVCMLRYLYDWDGVPILPIFTNKMTESLDENECRYADVYMRELIVQMNESSLTFKDIEFNIGASEKRYGSAQCSDIQGCHDCLESLRNQYSNVCQGWRAWWTVSYSTEYDDISNDTTDCAMRFGDLPFYILDGSPPARAPERRGEVANSNMSRTVIISIILSVITVSLVGCCINYLRCLNRSKKDQGPEAESRSVIFHDFAQNEDVLNVDVPTIPLSTILSCTGQFSDEFKLGDGGFGPVYKGILPDGRSIAVKLLSETSGQGFEEFKNEVTFINKLQHKNLVRLFGCCTEENNKLLLYEYMPNASLDVHLFDKAKRNQLHWNIRLNIINGIARGLLYLHEESQLRIIHRDLKAGNILLDHNMNPKISDFGLARIFRGYQRQANTQRIVGTYGYMAPEYAMDGLFSMKSDVFSFGVILLEILSGKRNNEGLLAYAWSLWCEDKSLTLMDSLLEKDCTTREVMKCIHIALLCVQEEAAERPTMSKVVLMLGSDEIILPTPNQPPFSVGSNAIQESASNKSNNCSINNVTISNVVPR